MRRQGTGYRAQGTGQTSKRAALASALALLAATSAAGQTRVLDDFTSIAEWKAAPSEGVTLAVSSAAAPSRSGRSMCFDFDFQGHGGWAAVRKLVDIELPANYELSLRIRGEAPSETLEVKLVDPSGENVWWSVRREFEFPHDWQTIRIKKRQISFAWGPAGDGDLKRAAAIEIAITAGSGGKGSVWVSDLTFTLLPPDHPYTGTPTVTASSSLPGHPPAQVLPGTGAGWRSDPRATGDQWLQVDFGERREFGGLVIDWDPAPASFAVETSEDGARWSTVWAVPSAHGVRSYVPMPETDARFIRVLLKEVPRGGVGVREIEVRPLEFAATPNDFISSVAKGARRGFYPRGFLGEMTAWTLVGDASPTRPAGLLGADGTFEPAPRSFSLEPFVWLDGALVTWADVTTRQSLLDGFLPIPTVTWRHPLLELTITAFEDTAGRSATVRYRLANRSGGRIAPTLLLAARPFQVDPPSQFLNGPGGVGTLASAACEGGTLRLDGVRVQATPVPGRCGAVAFDGGDVITLLRVGAVPEDACAKGPYPSAALAWSLDLGPDMAADLAVRVSAAASSGLAPVPQEAAAASWRETLGQVQISGPPEVDGLNQALGSNLAYILASRDGPALRPGTRSYARSWIRDGAMMAAALLRLGHPEEARDYLLWYAPFQFPSGKVPCCVDPRGADPVAENDSNGELLFLAAEYLRFTGDRVTVASVWPQLASAVAYLEELRHQRRTDAFRTPEKLVFFGLLPESISHEGYSAKPMHSYWDDFWALTGFDDAVRLADALGHPEEAARWKAARDEFKQDLLASIARVREAKALPYIPGCAELGDFDATSTTVALWPAGADAHLPREALESTFERYWGEVEARFTGKTAWEAYTPYEWRNVGVLVRLGWRDRAVKLANWLMADRMPIGWNQWPEVVWHDRTSAHFLGDLPHAWVGSDYIRSFLDMLAYERPSDGALVLGAGVPLVWLAGDGVSVRDLRTPYGPLSFTMRREGDALRVHVGPGIRIPPGGLVLRPPLPGGAHVALVNGRLQPGMVTDEVRLHTLSADVRIVPATEKR